MQTLSKEYQTFMNFMEKYESKLINLCTRLSEEWKYEKEQITNIIVDDLKTLGETNYTFKGTKIIIRTTLGNNRVGIIEITKSKYKFGVLVTK